MKSISKWVAGIALVGLGMSIGWSVKSAQAEAEKASHVFELRTYTTEPGKLPNLHARFKDHTIPLFEKHGIKNVVYFTPVDAEGKAVDNKLVYLLEHKSQEGAKKAFDDFRKDPDWVAAKAASEKDGKIVANVESVFYVPTNYSPMK